MNNKRSIHIIISLLVIVLLGSYYLWKLSSGTKVVIEKNDVKVKQEFVNIWSYNIWEFKQKIWEDYILIDIRTPWEISEWYIEWKDLEIDYYKDSFKSEIEKLDKTKKYLIYCRSWNRSWNALYLMKNLWFTDVHDLAWGIGTWARWWEKFIK